MLPLFKSDFSIGKSILRLDLKSIEENPESSIFNILTQNQISNLILVEDSMIGFMEAHKNSIELGVDLMFGIKISVAQDNDPKSAHKIIVFSKNKSGCKLLNKIYTFSQVSGEGSIDYKNLKKLWADDLLLAIPFYDSFIFNNVMYFQDCIPDFSFADPVFFIESNGLPFDETIKSHVLRFCEGNKYAANSAKSIYYNKKSDFQAFQTYKCLCSRGTSYRTPSLESPNLDHFSSEDFCFESYLEKCDT
jgi:DNA polymerase III alpha subunit